MAPETNGGDKWRWRRGGPKGKKTPKVPLLETIVLNTFGVGIVHCGAESSLLFAKGVNEVQKATHFRDIVCVPRK